MNEQDRDLRILEHILTYCDQIDMAVEHFGRSFETFDASPVYRNSVTLCILQIGELVGHLSEGFKTAHREIPWRQIRLMRNIVAHRYGTIDNTITWEVIENDLPPLKEFCFAHRADQASQDGSVVES